MELIRVAGIEQFGGQDMRHTASLYSLSSFETSIMDACVAALRRIYDSPLSEDGRELDKFLQRLEKDWNLESYFLRHRQELASLNLASGDYF